MKVHAQDSEGKAVCGVQGRLPLRYTTEPSKVTCLVCKRWREMCKDKWTFGRLIK